MPLELKYSSDFYRIEEDTSRSLLQTEWLRPVQMHEMVTGGTMLYEVLSQTGATLVVADASKLTNLSTETKEWMSSKFYELLSKTQLKKLARVVPEALFSRLALESVVTRAEAIGVTKFNVCNFTDPQKALDWLFK
ncbi:hypothetical protein [Pontibacter rugosus]|uniref:SpoIIAA-like protein n=1 Tax=Pontibacter rugosus TaxID=1745966 RepID=A0ABW3SVF0_9BACT